MARNGSTSLEPQHLPTQIVGNKNMPGLTIGRHEVHELAALFVRYLSDLERRSHKWRSYQRENILGLWEATIHGDIDEAWPNEDVVWKYINAFDQLFFASKLYQLIEVEVLDEKHPQEWAHCTWLQRRDRKSLIVIKVWAATPAFRSGRPQDRRAELMQTILHELVHAVFSLFACKCEERRQARYAGTGHTGHGPAWMNLANAIVDAPADLYFDFGNRSLYRDVMGIEVSRHYEASRYHKVSHAVGDLTSRFSSMSMQHCEDV
ncbi:hypothetical protein MMC25_003094 [Agyrium rufum]|nr:hypothetical protein [Agyrium rufum]